MFSGIVEEMGQVIRLHRSGTSNLQIEANVVVQGTRLGDSIAINGTCLTVTAMTANSFTVDVTPETFRRTNLGLLTPGNWVNLERSLCVGARIGGHFVQGHVDAVGKVRSLTREGESIIAHFTAPDEVMRYVVPKGFIAIDGMSLTVVERLPDGFTISFIPYTFAHSMAKNYRVNTLINLEADILGKYVERFIGVREHDQTVNRNFLAQHGFLDEEYS